MNINFFKIVLFSALLLLKQALPNIVEIYGFRKDVSANRNESSGSCLAGKNDVVQHNSYFVVCGTAGIAIIENVIEMTG